MDNRANLLVFSKAERKSPKADRNSPNPSGGANRHRDRRDYFPRVKRLGSYSAGPISYWPLIAGVQRVSLGRKSPRLECRAIMVCLVCNSTELSPMSTNSWTLAMLITAASLT